MMKVQYFSDEEMKRLAEFADGVIGYWTTSNDFLPSKEEAEELKLIIQGQIR